MHTKPNFIMIFPDQWRGDCLGCLDHPTVETPYLDHLASEGIVFTSAYAAAPSCIPARACLATGQTPSTCGRLGYQDRVPWRYRNTLMEVLRNENYQTINVGKTHFYPQRAHLGFEINKLYDPQRFLNDEFESDYHIWLDRISHGQVKDPAIEWENNSWVTLPWSGPDELHPSAWTTETAKEVLEHRDPMRPFFLQIGYHRPHPPYDPPQYYYDIYKDKELPPVPIGDWAEKLGHRIDKTNTFTGKLSDDIRDRMRCAYYASITHIDAQIGRLIFWLQKKGLYDNTYIIFLSDHGELLGDHHMYRKVNPMEGSAKIPLIIKPPKSVQTKRGVKEGSAVTHMDIMPTILQEAGIPIPDEVEGMSLSAIIQGKTLQERTFIHGEHTFEHLEQGWQFVTDGKHKYIWNSYSGEEWFFDLINDPTEETNLIGDETQASHIQLWRQRLIDILAQRPDDRLTDGQRLIAGKALPDVREELLI